MEDLTESCEKQIQGILEVVTGFSEGNFDTRANVNGEQELINDLALGVNRLGNELQESMISAKEKETLLKEIHHRVKNNLQVVSSILSLQAQFTDDVKVKRQFKECQDRVMSMALVHQKLYSSPDLANVELNEYVKSLTHQLMEAYDAKKVELKFNPSGCRFHTYIDNLLPIGLIINEVISNSLKYAFQEVDSPIISLELNCENKSDLELHIGDNGCGMKNIQNLEDSKTLGLQLIHTLSSQLDAVMELSNKNGLHYSFKIPNARVKN